MTSAPAHEPEASPRAAPTASTDLEALLEHLRCRFLRILLGRGIEANLAEDLVQEGLATVWRKLDQVRRPDRVHAWATSILLNRLRSHLSRQRVVEEISDERVGRGEGPLDALIHEEADRSLDRVLGGLKPEHREAITLRHSDGLTLSAACALIGVSKDILRRRLHSGLARLRRRIAREIMLGEAFTARAAH